MEAAGLTSEEREAAQLRRAWLCFIPAICGNVMGLLDTQIVASAINEIRAGLSASPDEIQWVQTAYLIADIVAIPMVGYLVRALSTRVFLTGCALGFTVASLGCAMSHSLGSMVVFRLLQGLLAGGMTPIASALIFILFPPGKRIVPQVIYGLIASFAPSMGPTIGGYLTTYLDWHWLFLVNLVPGVLIAIASWVLLDIDKPQHELLSTIDFQGVLYLAMFLGGFEYALDEGARKDWFADNAVAVASLMAVFGGILFFRRTLSPANPNPIVGLRVLANRNFAIGCSYATIIGMVVTVLLYLTPVFLSEVAGYNPLQIGRVMMVQGTCMLLSGPLAGRLMRMVEPRLMIGFGLVLVIAGTALNCRMTSEWGYPQFFWPQVLRGFGIIISFSPMLALAMGSLPVSEVQNASGLFNVTRLIGGASGLALVSTLLNQRNWQHWQQLAESTALSRSPVREGLHGMQQALAPHVGAGASQGGAIGLLAQQVQLQAAVMSFNDLYYLLTLSSVAALLLVPLIRRSRAPVTPVAAH